MTYITDLRHFLNEEGEIPGVLPQEARELASFLVLIVDAVTSVYPDPKWSIETGITCRSPGCRGEIVCALDADEGLIHWYCLDCGADGTISGWRASRWDNTKPGRVTTCYQGKKNS